MGWRRRSGGLPDSSLSSITARADTRDIRVCVTSTWAWRAVAADSSPVPDSAIILRRCARDHPQPKLRRGEQRPADDMRIAQGPSPRSPPGGERRLRMQVRVTSSPFTAASSTPGGKVHALTLHLGVHSYSRPRRPKLRPHYPALPTAHRAQFGNRRWGRAIAPSPMGSTAAARRRGWTVNACMAERVWSTGGAWMIALSLPQKRRNGGYPAVTLGRSGAFLRAYGPHVVPDIQRARA